MSVYILHLDSPLMHTRHYVGFAMQVERRLAHHRNGTGARFTQVCNERGITYQLARVFEQADRAFERKLKDCKHTARYCPICSGKKVRAYKPKG